MSARDFRLRTAGSLRASGGSKHGLSFRCAVPLSQARLVVHASRRLLPIFDVAREARRDRRRAIRAGLHAVQKYPDRIRPPAARLRGATPEQKPERKWGRGESGPIRGCSCLIPHSPCRRFMTGGLTRNRSGRQNILSAKRLRTLGERARSPGRGAQRSRARAP